MISPAWLEPSGPGWSGSRWTMKSSASPPSVKRARLPNTSSPTKKTWAQAAIHLVRARGRPDPGERDGLEPRTRWWRRQGSELASRPIRRTNAPDSSLSRVSENLDDCAKNVDSWRGVILHHKRTLVPRADQEVCLGTACQDMPLSRPRTKESNNP